MRRRRKRNPVSLTGGAVGVLGLFVIGGIAAYWLGRKFDQAKAATVQTAFNIAAPSGVSPLANPVSEWFGSLFKSDAEKAADAMLKAPLPAPETSGSLRTSTGYTGSTYTGGH